MPPMQQPAMQPAMQPATQQLLQQQLLQQQQPPRDITALQICTAYSLCCPCGLCTGLVCFLQNKDDPDENARNWAKFAGLAGCCNCGLALALQAANPAAPPLALAAVKTALASKTATVAPAMVTMT